ncbi:MAG: DUF1223 domain-containing protein [Pseudomonadota bacterium]
MKRLLTTIATLMWFALPVHAGDRPVVVELFTSQGCSSCPPADAFLHKLDSRDDVIALALHVDYWDYIGWKDNFADPAHTERQRDYAKADGRRMIYTPQMVIDGTSHVVGNRPKDVLDLIKMYQRKQDTVALTAGYDSGQVTLQAERLDGNTVPLSVVMLRYSPRNEVRITAGENAGRSLNYANVVTDMRKLDVWDGSEPLFMNVQAPGDEPIVILLQQKGGAGAIEAAIQLP